MKIFDIYLAGPYTHESEEVMTKRYEKLTEITAVLTKRGFRVFSPITHSHPLKKYGVSGGYLKSDTNLYGWQDTDRQVILGCREVHVLKLPGWEESVGVTDEIDWAKRHDIPVKFIEV